MRIYLTIVDNGVTRPSIHVMSTQSLEQKVVKALFDTAKVWGDSTRMSPTTHENTCKIELIRELKIHQVFESVYTDPTSFAELEFVIERNTDPEDPSRQLLRYSVKVDT